MNAKLRPLVSLFGLVLLVAVLAGCATGPDWNTRIGSYTYDQAIVDMGPPDKSAKLSDGTTVAEWLAYRSGTGRAYVSGGYGYGGYGWGYPYYHGSAIIVDGAPSYESFLRLVFAPDGTMRSWRKFTR